MSDTTPLKKSRFASLFIMILLLSMLGVGGWAAWIFMLQPLPKDSLVVLRADPTPFKVKPAADTQADIPNQDSTFMNLIEGNAEKYQNTEIISLSDPAPEPPPVSLTKPKDKISQIAKENNFVSNDTAAQTQLLTERIATDSKKIADKYTGTARGQLNADSTQENITSTQAEQIKPESTDLTAALNLPAMPTSRPKVTKLGQGEMMVQLAAFRKEDKAKTAAALLNQKHADRLQGYQLDVRSVKSTDGQLFWRVITDPLPKQDALSICDGLKRAGQDCIIRQAKAKQP